MPRRENRRRIRISRRAARHLENDIEHLARTASLELALRFQEAVANELDQLARFPGLGSPRPGRSPRLAHLRMRPIRGFPNWRIYYLEEVETLEVIWILHAAEDRDRIVAD